MEQLHLSRVPSISAAACAIFVRCASVPGDALCPTEIGVPFPSLFSHQRTVRPLSTVGERGKGKEKERGGETEREREKEREKERERSESRETECDRAGE